MKKSGWILLLTLLLTLSIYASPAPDSLEFTATLCQFSDTGLSCSCHDEVKENKSEQERLARKVRGNSCESVDNSCVGMVR